MARVDNLDHFLTDVADAIRTKKGTQATIQASNFDTEIENLPSGGGSVDDYFYNIVSRYVVSNGVSYLVKKLENVQIPSALTSFSSIFNGYTGIVLTFDKDNVDTSNVTSLFRAFNGCSNLTSLDLSMFDTSLVTNMDGLFYNCSSLMFLDIRNFTFDSVTTSSNMLMSVPTNCEIIVKSQTEKDWFATNFSAYTNVKTVAEYEAEQNS